VPTQEARRGQALRLKGTGPHGGTSSLVLGIRTSYYVPMLHPDSLPASSRRLVQIG